MQVAINESKLKELIKQALVEALEERKDVVYEILSEVIEDIGLAQAIREGEASDLVDEREILDIVRRNKA